VQRAADLDVPDEQRVVIEPGELRGVPGKRGGVEECVVDAWEVRRREVDDGGGGLVSQGHGDGGAGHSAVILYVSFVFRKVGIRDEIRGKTEECLKRFDFVDENLVAFTFTVKVCLPLVCISELECPRDITIST
jgi:hypothetical protein